MRTIYFENWNSFENKQAREHKERCSIQVEMINPQVRIWVHLCLQCLSQSRIWLERRKFEKRIINLETERLKVSTNQTSHQRINLTTLQFIWFKTLDKLNKMKCILCRRVQERLWSEIHSNNNRSQIMFGIKRFNS